MIRMFLDSTAAGAAGSVKLRWCAPRDVLEDAHKRGQEVWLLLAVVSDGKNDYADYQNRQAVQLNAGATYISFKYAGTNRVFAHVFYGTRYDAQCMLERETFGLNDTSADWRETAATLCADIDRFKARLAEFADPSEEAYAVERNQLTSQITVTRDRIPVVRAEENIRGASDPIDVPAECFAKEWPALVNDWVNFIKWHGAPTDECNRRRRALFSITVQPLIMPLVLLFRIVVAIFLGPFLGIRGITYAAAFRPLKYDTDDVWRNSGRPFWIPDDDAPPVRLALIPFAPIFILIGAAVVGVVKAGLTGWHPTYLHGFLAWVAAGVIGAAAIELSIALFIGLMILLVTYGAVMNPFRWMACFLSGGSAKLSIEDISRLECAGDCTPATKRERRTIRLWFLDVKARICRPLQG